MNRPPADLDLSPWYRGEERGHQRKTLVVLHETVSHDKPGLDDIKGVASFLDSTGLEIHGIIDKEANVGWCYDRTAIFDHAGSNGGNVNSRSVGFELVSDIPLLSNNAARKAAWLADDRKKQLNEVARWIAWLSTVEPIPLRFSLGEVPGITTHFNVSQTYGVSGGHWDCKPIHAPWNGHFPALYVVAKAKQILEASEL